VLLIVTHNLFHLNCTSDACQVLSNLTYSLFYYRYSFDGPVRFFRTDSPTSHILRRTYSPSRSRFGRARRHGRENLLSSSTRPTSLRDVCASLTQQLPVQLPG
jgi:hypothetical protein